MIVPVAGLNPPSIDRTVIVSPLFPKLIVNEFVGFTNSVYSNEEASMADRPAMLVPFPGKFPAVSSANNASLVGPAGKLMTKSAAVPARINGSISLKKIVPRPAKFTLPTSVPV